MLKLFKKLFFQGFGVEVTYRPQIINLNMKCFLREQSRIIN